MLFTSKEWHALYIGGVNFGTLSMDYMYRVAEKGSLCVSGEFNMH